MQDALDSSVDMVAHVISREDVSEDASALITQLLDIQLQAQQSIADSLVRSSTAIASSVRRLSSLGTRANLPRQMCIEVVDTGAFERAMFSTVDESGWEGHIEVPQRLDGRRVRLMWDQSPVERECLQTRRVFATGVDCPATEAVAAHLSARDYVVAPVVAESRVVGLLHASRRLPMEVDTDSAAIMDLLVSTFGAAYEREVWTYRALAHQQIVNERVAQLIQHSEQALGSDFEIASAPTELTVEQRRVPKPDAAPALDWLLTSREAEVMHLIAEGASNAEIADELFIAVETVKSHVKSILRKLGAVNRSEAISLYLDRR
jgi:DNA-binding CsgD family transcriptional regulator